jgi:hypothetical protein
MAAGGSAVIRLAKMSIIQKNLARAPSICRIKFDVGPSSRNDDGTQPAGFLQTGSQLRGDPVAYKPELCCKAQRQRRGAILRVSLSPMVAGGRARISSIFGIGI